MYLGAILAGTHQSLKTFFAKPKEHTRIQHREPLLKRTPLKTFFFELRTIKRFLISYDGSAVYWMVNHKGLRSLFIQNRAPRFSWYFKQVKESLRAEQTVTLDTGPATTLSHVVEARVVFREFRRSNAHHHARRSMMLRKSNLVEIKLTGAAATFSTCSMNWMSSTSNCSNLRAFSLFLCR